MLIYILEQEISGLTDFSERSPLHNYSKRFFVSAVAVNHINNRISNIKRDKIDNITKITRLALTSVLGPFAVYLLEFILH